MKIGISYWGLQGGLDGSRSVPEALQEAHDLGFEAIELGIASSGVLTDKTSQAECEDIAAAAQKIGIEISSLASGESWGSSPTADDPAVRQRIVNFTRKALQVARWMGLNAYLYVPGAVDVFFNPQGEVVPYDVCYNRARESLGAILPEAERLGVSLCVENVWNKFLLSPLEMRDFIDSFHSAQVGCYFDVGNVLTTGYPQHWIHILGPRVKRVHVKDFRLSVGTADGFVDLLEGDVPFPAARKALEDIGYDGYVTAEILPWEPGRPAKTAAAMRKIFK